MQKNRFTKVQNAWVFKGSHNSNKTKPGIHNERQSCAHQNLGFA